ncbi:MAG: SGNH/GDSL hydrolase family protein [Thermoanaerobaculia bacterium]|nr:SGNH/GDSL hydrolase family protein [Thermoanaerobaculia bacterium]
MLVRGLRVLASNVLVPAAIAVALLLALEGGCRVGGRLSSGSWPVTAQEKDTDFVRQIGQAYRRHPFLSVAGRPGGVARVPGHDVRFNSLGIRGPEVEMPKPAGRFRVVCEGGSTTFDLLAADDASTWPALLGGLLGPDADVVNGGFPGWTSVQSLIALELRDVDLGPDVVVVYSGINDLQPAGHVPFARDYSTGHGEILPRVLGADPPPLPLVARSVFIEWVRVRLGRSRRGVDDRGYAPAWEWEGGARRPRMPEEAVEVYARNLRSTVAVARAFGARTLLVAQTARIRKGTEAPDRSYLESWTPGLDADGYLDGVARYNAAARALAGEGLADFVDPFADDLFSDADFADPVHFSAAGSRKFAARIAAELGRIRSAGGGESAANIRAAAPAAHRDNG